MATGGATPSWSDRLHEARNRILADRRFQSWAAAFPLTRPIARRRSRALFDLCAGFVYSQILLACVRLNVLQLLADGPLPVAEVAARLRLKEDAARRLLKAAAALDLLAMRKGDRCGLGPLGAALNGNPGLAAMIEHHALLYDDLRDPVALLRGEMEATGIGRYWPYAGGAPAAHHDAATTAPYTALMAATQAIVAEEILAAYPLGRHKRLLDVGGGDGAFLEAAARRTPKLDLMLFDLPAVAEAARLRFATAGLTHRTSVFSGNFLADPLPRGADLIALVRVIHDHDDANALRILTAARQALAEGGDLIVAEPMAEMPGAGPVGDAYFGFYLLAMGSGRARTPAELTALLRAAGFAASRIVRTRLPLLTGMIVAHA